MGDPITYADAMLYFRMFGAMFAFLLFLFFGCRSWMNFFFNIPLFGAVFMFGIVLMILTLGVGFFFMTEYWGWSAAAQLHVKYIYFGIVMLLGVWLVVWAHRPSY